MWDNLLLDFLYLSSDCMSGKTIPVLYAITQFHLDPHLLGTVVLLGALVATVINVYKTSRPTSNIVFDCSMRFIQFSLSILLTMGLLARLMQQMYTSGVFVATIPCFWVLIHALPEKPVTLQVMCCLTFALFYLSLIASPTVILEYTQNPTDYSVLANPLLDNPVVANSLLDNPVVDNPVLDHQRALLAMTRKEWRTMVKTHSSSASTTQTVQNILPQCIYILILTVYACTMHGPFYAYTGKYCSPTLLVHRVYAVFICFLASVFRAYFIITIAWMQQNVIHLILERDTDLKFAMWLWIHVLLLSANWNITQVSEQLLTLFNQDAQLVKIKYTITLFAVAYLFRWMHDLTALTCLCLFQLVTMSFSMVYY